MIKAMDSATAALVESPSQHWVPAPRKLGVGALVAITFFNVSGGPFGSELVVGALGPLPGLLGLALFPLLWGLPLCLITAELCAYIPENGGYSIWVHRAFGPMWGFQESYWSWISGVIDNAVYPVLAYDTAIKPFVSVTSWYGPWAIKAALAVLWTLPNLFSAQFINTGLVSAMAFIMLPFVLLSLLALSKANWTQLGTVRSSAIASWSSWGDLVNILYWNFSGFDCSSTCAGEVARPAVTYKKSLLIALALITATYAIPLVTCAAADRPSWTTWDDGSFSDIAKAVAGDWLLYWLLVATFFSNFGMFLGEMFEDAWQLFGIADIGMAPRIFCYRHPRFHTPWNAVLFSLVLIVALVGFEFKQILVLDNFFSVASTLLEIVAFIQLRHTQEDLVPLFLPTRSIPKLLLILAVPITLAVGILAANMYTSWVLCISGLVFGFAFYAVLHHCLLRQYRPVPDEP